MPLEKGKVYKLRHSRKGVAVCRVLSDPDEWVDLELLEGEFRGGRGDIQEEAGDLTRVRTSLVIAFVEVGEVIEPCFYCNGKGGLNDVDCGFCDGSGVKP